MEHDAPRLDRLPVSCRRVDPTELQRRALPGASIREARQDRDQVRAPSASTAAVAARQIGGTFDSLVKTGAMTLPGVSEWG